MGGWISNRAGTIEALAMAKSSPLYRIDVVPLTPLYGRPDPRFSYASSESIPTGSLVSISFGHQTLSGVVLVAHRLPGPVPKWMKFVGPVILPAWLTEDQITLAWELSDRLYTPLGIVFKLFFPLQRKPREKKASADGVILEKTRKKSRLKAVRKKISITPAREGMANDIALFDRLRNLGEKARKEKRSLLILVPEVLAAELYAEKLAHALPDANVGCLSSRRTDREAYFLHAAIRENALDIIVGTRQAVFAPFVQLSAVVIVDAEKQLSYSQWEMTPRYDAIEIAEMLARTRNVPCLRISVAPGIEYFAPDIPLEKTGAPFAFSSKHTLVPIDLRRTYRRGQGSQPLSFDLIATIRKAQKSKESVLILVGQRGLSRFSLCAKCQLLQRCPTCQATLSEAKDSRFRCLSCGYRSGIFPSCRACGHMHFKSFGAGTQTIARVLHQEGISNGETIIVDRDTQSLKSGFERLLGEFIDPKGPLIVVATYESAYSLPLPPLGVVAMVEPDQGLFYPDFQSEERLWRELRRFGAKLKNGGTLFVQTFEPENPYWTTWAQSPLKTTAAALLEERRTLHYPPYYQLIRLDCHPKKSLSSESVAAMTEDTLRALKLPDVEILPKYLPFGRKNRYHILIRLPRELPLPSELHACLSTLDPAVHITRNPLSLHG